MGGLTDVLPEQVNLAKERWVECGKVILLLVSLALLLSIAQVVCDSIWYGYRRRVQGCQPLKTSYNWPLGIRNTSRLVKAVMNSTVLDEMEEIWRSSEDRSMRISQGGAMWIGTVEPENIKSILATDFYSYSLGFRREALYPLLGNGIFTLSGPEWKHSRAMLRPQFSREQVSHTEMVDQHAHHLLNLLEVEEFIDAQELFHLFTLDTATEFLFGESANCLTTNTGRRFADAFGYSLRLCSIRIILGKLYWAVQSRRFWSSCKYIHEFVDKYVQRALNATKPSERYVFIEALTSETRDPVAIRSEALNILLAGRDTTASTLSYAVWYLGMHKECFASLRTAVSDLALTYEDLKACKPLQNVINEVLRLHPIVPMNFRTAIRDTKLPVGNIFIPKGTNVFYNPYALQRDPKIWGEDAAEFRPDRWDEHRPKAWEYIPFNGGPRICLGQQFALTELSLVLTRICQRFEDIEILSPRGAGKLPQAYRLTSSIAGGVMARFTSAK